MLCVSSIVLLALFACRFWVLPVFVYAGTVHAYPALVTHRVVILDRFHVSAHRAATVPSGGVFDSRHWCRRSAVVPRTRVGVHAFLAPPSSLVKGRLVLLFSAYATGLHRPPTYQKV